MRLRALACALPALLVPALAAPARADMVIASAPPSETDIYYQGAGANFAFSRYDFSGIGTTGGPTDSAWVGQTATMISDRFFVSAAHWHPGPGTTVVFTGAGGQEYSFTVGGGEQVPGSDIWVGWLASAIPASDGIASYAIAPDDLAAQVGQTALMVGNPYRVGEGVINNAAGGGPYVGLSYDPNTNPLAAYVESGDSGMPTFLVNPNGTLSVLGTHSSYMGPISWPGTPPDGYYMSFDNYVPWALGGTPDNPTDYIARIEADAPQLDPVPPTPEPASLALLGLGTAAALAYRRARGRSCNSSSGSTPGR